MKRTLSILLTIAMIISLIPAVFAADVPTMSTTVDKTEVQPGDTITLTLSIDKTITNLNNWEWAIYFDKTAYVKTSGELEPGCMSGTGTTGAVGDNVDILGKNAIRVSGLSTTGDPVTLNAGKIATVTFTATENITAENARIEVKTEALPDYNTLEDNSVNLAGNIIDVTVVTTEEKGYTVSMGDDKQAAFGQTVEIPVTIGYSDDSVTGYNAYDMSFSYDSSALKLDMEETNEEGNRVMLGDNSVRIVRYGKEAALGEALTLKFEVLAGKGSSNVTVTSAKVDTNGNAIEADAPDATILRPTATVTVSGYTVTLPDEVHKTLDMRTDPTWPTTWFAPKLTGKGPFTDVYSVMANWGANHGAFCYGHIGADLITMASMLRIPVSMHNVDASRIFRPSAWAAFGTADLEGADYRACQNFGPLYK